MLLKPGVVELPVSVGSFELLVGLGPVEMNRPGFSGDSIT